MKDRLATSITPTFTLLFLLSLSASGQVPGNTLKRPDPAQLAGNFSRPRMVERRKLDEPGNLVQGSDQYLRRAGEEISLLRVAGEAALLLSEQADDQTTLREAINRTGVVVPLPTALARFSNGRKLALVRSADDAKVPDRVALKSLPGVVAVQPVLVDPVSRLRMIPSGELILRLKPGLTPADVQPDLQAAGLTLVQRVGSVRMSTYLVRQSDPADDSLGLARQLFQNPKIEWATPNFVRETQLYFTPNDPLFGQQQHLHNTGQQGGVPDADVDAPEAWDLSQGSSSIVIAIVDDGVDTTHPDLSIRTNPGETGGGKETNGIDDDGNGFIDDWRGWDFANGDNNPNPVGGNGHGTACAGVAAGKINNAYRTTGIAGNCRILPVKIFADSGVATTDANIGNAISYAVDNGADVLSNSWGGGSPSAFIDAAISDAVTNGRGGLGCPVFFANGNSATRWSKIILNVGTDLGTGTWSFGLRYNKDVSVNSGEDLIKVDNVVLIGSDGYTHIPSSLGPNGRQDFEGAFPPTGWTLSSSTGANSWTTTTSGVFSGAGGTKSARSGAITHNQWTELRTPTVSLAGNETLALQVYVSSESGFDGLIIRIYNSVGTFVGNYSLISGVFFASTPIGYPASNPDAISVGASTDSDRRSDYSEYGPENDFVAPSNGGWNGVTTLDPTGTVGYSTSDYTQSFGGTSSATPLAAGVGALLLSVNPGLTAVQVRDTMRNTADKIGPIPYVGGFNNEYGYGRINARAALDAISGATVTVAATDASASEPVNSGTFTFTRTGSTASALTVNFTVDGTAIADTDYMSLGSSVTFGIGAATAIKIVSVLDDNTVESTETVIVTLAAGAGYAIGVPSSDTVNLADDDATITVAATDPTAGEPGTSQGTGTFTFTRTGNLSPALTVNCTVGGTATSGIDCTSMGTMVAFAPGSPTATATVTVLDDAVVEGDETVDLTLVAGTGYSIGIPPIATVTIQDDDLPVVTVVATDATASEPSDAGTFTFSRTGPTASALTVNFTAGGTASAGTDYNSIGTTVDFAAGSATAVKDVTPINDFAAEGSETVTVTVVSGSGYTVGSPSLATVTVQDDDSVIEDLLVDNADGPAQVEVVGAWTASTISPGYWGVNYLHDGNTGKGAKSVTFTPTIGTAGSYGVFIWYIASANRASNVPVDVIHSGGTTTLTVNQRLNGSRWVSLGIFDFAAGTTGRVKLRTTGTDGYVIVDAIKLQPASAPSVVTVVATDATASEPSDAGTFTFSRTGPTASALTVNFTAGGTASAGTDYNSIGTTVDFAAGSATAVKDVTPINDFAAEGSETVTVTVVSGSGYTVGSPSLATVTVQDDDSVIEDLLVDNADGPAQVEVVGAWTASTISPGYWGVNYLHDGNTGKGAKSVTFTPTIGTAGSYEVFIWYIASANRASNVPVDVIHSGGTTTLTINQRLNGSRWVSLGIFDFAAGTTGRVKLRTTGTDGYVIVDAIKLQPAGGALGFGVAGPMGIAHNPTSDVFQRPLAIGSLKLAGGEFSLSIFGERGRIYALTASTNLVDWILLDQGIGTDSELRLTDSEARQHTERFYHVLALEPTAHPLPKH